MMTPALEEWFGQYDDKEIIELVCGDIKAHLDDLGIIGDLGSGDHIGSALELLDFLKERIGESK